MKPKLLFLFPDGWDRIAFASTVGWRDEFDIVCEGFDLFRFPESANILWFDACRFIDRLARKYHRGGIQGVVSTNEQYGALIAAMLARRLGLPGTDPLAIKRAQHKYYAREAMASAIPDATPRYIVFPPSIDAARAAALPVRGFSPRQSLRKALGRGDAIPDRRWRAGAPGACLVASDDGAAAGDLGARRSR